MVKTTGPVTALAAVLLWPGACLLAGEAGPPPRPTITDITEIWTLPAVEKTRAQPVRIEGRISYFDPEFSMVWIEQNGVGTYLQLASDPPPLRTGERVQIEGKITPNNGLSAKEVTIRVLEEDAPILPLDTRGRINDLTAFHARIVTTEGYVDSQQTNGPDHVRLILIVENRPVICWVKPDNPKSVPDWRGSFVRVTGLYSRKFDPTQTNTTIEIWVGRQNGLQVLGTLQNSERFDLPATPISELSQKTLGAKVKVHGQVVAHRVGNVMTVRDETGQVDIRSIQKQRLPVGSEVEAAGEVDISSGQWVIDPGLYRPVQGVAISPKVAANPVLTSVAQIRALSAEEAAKKQPVDLRGVVIWAIPEGDFGFFYLQDVTGGVRVYFDRAKTGPIRFDKYFRIKGVTEAGQFAPAVQMVDFTDLGSLSHPAARPITLEQAMTGKEEGQWVELRGFLRDTVSEGDWRWIHVTTPEGDFTGHLQNPVNFVANPGALIRVSGVCETTADADGYINGLTLRVPFLQDISLDEDAPADFYNLPLRSIRDLDQLSARQEMTRVRISGVVLHAVHGGAVYVQDGDAAVLMLSHEKAAVAPGDKIEAVGILGRAGVRTVLREAIYRKIGPGPAPGPMAIKDPALLSLGNDSRLVQVRGILVDKLDRLGRIRLTMQAGNTMFEADLERLPKATPLDFTLGTGLELTGIYRLEFDDSRQMRGFQLLLRSPDDIVVYQEPRLWTVQRALVVVAILGGCTLLGLGWIAVLRRQVRRQTEQIRAQLEHQARLEIEVQRAARLESLGELAGGIAHDFNNVLTGIMGYTSIAMLDKSAMTLVGDCLREIERGGRRARDLTQQLLTFAKGGDPLRETISLPGLIQEATELILHGSSVRCEYEVPPGLWSVNADRGQITQVIQNLMRNAMQAMPHGGEIRVLLANDEIDAGAKAGLAAGRYVRLSMTDTGEGIKAEQLPRIFDPYFSTKKAGGLGLATVHSIVKKHQGHIEVQSAQGKGTTFRIWLPAAEPAAPPPAVQPATKGPAGPVRVLLMDDEESIRHLGALVLRRMGLEATSVVDGEAALREFDNARNAGRPYDLVILDLTVPQGLGGRETIEQLRKKDPEILAIVSSGYSSDPVMANFRNYGFQGVVPKPYNIEQFTRMVERLLEENRGIRPGS